MKILLIGEYSNVHWTLAEGLRSMGHRVCVVSNGDYWKNYKRNISLVRKSPGKIHGWLYVLQLLFLLPRLRGYDVVQLINPIFFELKAERLAAVYKYLKKHNKKIFLNAFGMDYYWVSTCTTTDTFRYSDFNIGARLIENATTRAEKEDWLYTSKSALNRMIAHSCNGIIAGMYEYYACYYPYYFNKLTYIPFPIDQTMLEPASPVKDGKIRFFIGIQKTRNEYKGTDVMYRALLRVQEKYPDKCEIVKAESVPFKEYCKMLNGSDVLLDQLYGYSPGMNALLAMGKGMVVVGGGEPECYNIVNEKKLRPIINVLPNEEDVFTKLENIVLHPERLPLLKSQSKDFVAKHHNHIKVAKRYLSFWGK